MLIIGLLSSTSIEIIIITELRAAQRGGGITGRGEKPIVVVRTNHQKSKDIFQFQILLSLLSAQTSNNIVPY
jgi:hypothetical protein